MLRLIYPGYRNRCHGVLPGDPQNILKTNKRVLHRKIYAGIVRPPYRYGARQTGSWKITTLSAGVGHIKRPASKSLLPSILSFIIKELRGLYVTLYSFRIIYLIHSDHGGINANNSLHFRRFFVNIRLIFSRRRFPPKAELRLSGTKGELIF